MSDSERRRLRRLAEDLEDAGLPLAELGSVVEMLVEEVDHALRPRVHERMIPSVGTILEPATPPVRWSAATQLDVTRGPLGKQPLADARRFADGLSSWLLRRVNGEDEWIVFDRPAGSERDLVVLVSAFGATIVQRHPSGTTRVAGGFGILRWEGTAWHHERPVSEWMKALDAQSGNGTLEVLEAMLRFAIHDLGSNGIGALLVYRTTDEPGPPVEGRLPEPPPLQILKASHLAPLRHALAQVDGAAMFDPEGKIRQLGVRLIPSRESEKLVDPLRGTRHTSARRYSYDDPSATVIAVSEDGPITVLRHGEVLTRS